LDLASGGSTANHKLLDLACGNGVLAKSLPKNVEYMGVDIAPSLIKEARRTDHNSKHKYLITDVTKPLPISEQFDAATIILALQNISNPQNVLNNASKLLNENCKLVIVLNHPAFRIPRQSAWGVDTDRKIQYRRIDKYMSPMAIPINPHTYETTTRFSTNPKNIGVGVNESFTISYHFPLSAYAKMLKDAGFVIEEIEEWTSDKESEGRAARMENRGRAEIPLFLAIKAVKK